MRVKFSKNSHTDDEYFLVSKQDYKRVTVYKWYLTKPDISGNSYVRSTVGGKILHRFILSITARKVRVDHKNMNTLDNTRPNLRACTPSQNAGNKLRQKNKRSSNYKGVFQRPETGKFRVMIGFNSKIIHLGQYDTEIEWARAYDTKAIELFGEFARTNFQGERK